MARNFKVLHTQVDSWPKDSVLSESDLHESADVKRLIDIGAIKEVEEARTGPPPLGPDTIVRDREAKAKVDELAEKAKPAKAVK